jgi:hypothetical protein
VNPDVTECKDLPREGSNASCSNGVDDDKDGLEDCEDPACRAEGIVVCNGMTPVDVDPADYTMLSNAACSNGTDENMNNFTDCDDFGCQLNGDVTVCPEANDAECSDGVDNDDTDDFVDCGDFSCSQNPNVTVCDQEISYADCSDGLDNNGNDFADCNDFSCNPSNGPKSPACL